jgi:sulfur-oxidizing protein SoxB
VNNAGGVTLVTNAGSNGKFLAVLDLDIAKGKVADVRYRLLPVFSELLKPDAAMQALIDKMRRPTPSAYDEKLGTADRLLYRRGNFSGTMDLLICDALRSELDAEIALSPGFRWGTTALAGQPLTMEDIFSGNRDHLSRDLLQKMTGAQIRDVLEDVCDNLFNADPYYQQGGDMVRVGGLTYAAHRRKASASASPSSSSRMAHALEAGKTYKVAGWASVNEQNGAPVWDVVAKHLRAGRPPNRQGPGVTLKGVDDNPGIAGLG